MLCKSTLAACPPESWPGSLPKKRRYVQAMPALTHQLMCLQAKAAAEAAAAAAGAASAQQQQQPQPQPIVDLGLAALQQQMQLMRQQQHQMLLQQQMIAAQQVHAAHQPGINQANLFQVNAFDCFALCATEKHGK